MYENPYINISCRVLLTEVSIPDGGENRLASGGHMLLSPDLYMKLIASGSTTITPRSSTAGATVSNLGAFTCTRCGNAYARPHSLNRHLRFECGVEPKFECPICHKKSKHKHNLMLHMRTHQNR